MRYLPAKAAIENATRFSWNMQIFSRQWQTNPGDDSPEWICINGDLSPIPANSNSHHQGIPSFYHSTDTILHEVGKLAADCPGSTLQLSVIGSGPSLLVAEFRSLRAIDEPRKKSMFLFGEHARELIARDCTPFRQEPVWTECKRQRGCRSCFRGQ